MSPSAEYLSGYSVEELMAVVIAREIRDGEVCASGTLSPIPAAGLYLAKETTAPSATIVVMGGEPWPFLVGHKECFDLAQRGRLDLFFLSGAQVDRQANINLTAIGSYERPKVRLPGGAGSAMLYYMAKRVILFKTDHNVRSFVEKVDFKTSAGVVKENVHRLGGPWKVVTPLCVLAFDGAEGELVLDSIHPGVDVDEVMSNTGWRLKQRTPLATTPPPTEEDLRLLRTSVRERLRSAYPEFAATAMRPVHR
ncbi:MAG: CoA-transferase subunit beta [Chloroflexota bacterium]